MLTNSIILYLSPALIQSEMKKYKLIQTWVFAFALTGMLLSCKSGHDNQTYLGVKVSDIETQADNLLKNYYPRIIDTIHGGYWTNFENDWSRSPNQEKMLVTQARGLWTASRATQMFPDNKIYRKAADHGYKFLITQMWDSLNGGFFLYYYPDSSVKVEKSFKLTYANAFALYGLSEYAKINKDPAVLAWVKKEFDWLETRMHDSVDLGYFNIWMPQAEKTPANKKEKDSGTRPSGWGDPSWKDQNTSIHLLEAFTNAYQVLPEPDVKARLAEMLMLVRDSMTTSDGYLRLYFDRKWKPVDYSDSSREFILKHILTDHISFGHNIETAFLLTEASQTLYGSIDSLTLKVARKMIDHTIKYGFDKDYAGVFDKGFMFEPGKVEIIDSTKVWWSQAEAWHASALFSQLYPNDPVYPKVFANMWNYINKNIIDPVNGGWYNEGIDKTPAAVKERKAHEWKGCYHDGRALMQVLSYAKEQNEKK
jgi:cellobiose epimerase